MHKISVIIPVYKVEPYLDRCIESVVNQSYRELEIILVDDGSPDRCGAMCDEWADKDSRIQVIHQQNEGLSAARNAGIDRATGEYLCFVDSDDWIESDMVDHLFKAALKAADIVCCNFVYEYGKRLENNTLSVKAACDYQFQTEMVMDGAAFLKMMNSNLYVVCEVAWNKLYQRKCFENYRYPKGKIHEDEFAIHHSIYPCHKIVCIPYVGYHYVQRRDSIMHENGRPMDYIEALLDRCNYFLKKNEQELTLANEGRLLSAVKKAEKQLPKQELQLIKQAYFRTVWKIWMKMWIPATTLIKRFVRCKLI